MFQSSSTKTPTSSTPTLSFINQSNVTSISNATGNSTVVIPKPRIISPTLDSIRTVNANKSMSAPVKPSLMPFSCESFTQSNPIYNNQNGLFSVSSLVNMTHSPPPKSLEQEPLDKALNSSLADASTSLVLLDQSRVAKEIFNACKVGDLNRLKKYINSLNVNIRDNSGGRSTVKFHYFVYSNFFIFLYFSAPTFCIWIWTIRCCRISYTKWCQHSR